MPQNVGPTLFDKPHSSFFHNSNTTPWMVRFNNALYAFLEYGVGTRGAHFYKSTDNGNTWAELDAANAPAVNDAFLVYDLANSRAIVCFNPLPTPSALQLQVFSLVDAAEAWGAVIAAGGPVSQGSEPIWNVLLRPDSSIVVVFDSGVGAQFATRMKATTWDGAAWLAPVDLGVNMPFVDSRPGHTTIQPASCVMDATGLIHCFLVGVGAGLQNYWGYQQFKTDNTLGNFHVFGTGAAFDDARGTNMVVVGGSLILGILSDVAPFAFQTVLNQFVGTPLANPVWTQTQPAALVNPNRPINVPTVNFSVLPGAGTAITVGLVSLNGGASNAAYLLNSEAITAAGPVVVAQFVKTDDNGFLFVQLFTSTDLGTTWTLLPSDAVPNFNYYLGFSPVDPAIDIPPAAFNGILIPSLQLVAGAPAPPAGGNISIEPTGGGGLRGGRSKGGDMNADDACVDRWANLEYGALRRALARGLLCNPISNLQAANVVASQQEPIFKSGAIVAPAKGTVENQVLNFDLEKGFAAIITGLAWDYVGNGFVDGSGGIIWLVMIDYRFVPGYSQVLQAFGDDQQPRPVLKGIPVGPGQNVQVLVSIPVLSPITVGGATQIFAAVSGVKFPVR